MRTRVSGVNHLNLMRAVASLEHLLEHSCVVAFEASGPTERISDNHNSENAWRLFERIVAVIKTKLICHRAVIAFTKDTRAGARVCAHPKSHIRIVFKASCEEI